MSAKQRYIRALERAFRVWGQLPPRRKKKLLARKRAFDRRERHRVQGDHRRWDRLARYGTVTVSPMSLFMVGAVTLGFASYGLLKKGPT